LYFQPTAKLHVSVSRNAQREFFIHTARLSRSKGKFADSMYSRLMRQALGIDKSVDILDHCHSLPPDEEAAALEKIRSIEREAMVSQQPQPGIVPLMEYLESREIPRGICTRNFDAPVNHLLTKFLPSFEFSPGSFSSAFQTHESDLTFKVVTRDFKPPKPSPAGILHIAKSWGFTKEENGEVVGDAGNFIMVG